MHRHKTAWYSIRPPVSTRDFGDVSSCEVGGFKGSLGRAQRAGAVAGATGREQRAGAEAGCRALEDGSGKEGEPKANGAGRAGNIDHAAVTVNHSEARRTRQAVDTGPALRFGGSKGGPGASAASWGGSGVPGVGGR